MAIFIVVEFLITNTFEWLILRETSFFYLILGFSFIRTTKSFELKSQKLSDSEEEIEENMPEDNESNKDESSNVPSLNKLESVAEIRQEIVEVKTVFGLNTSEEGMLTDLGNIKV